MASHVAQMDRGLNDASSIVVSLRFDVYINGSIVSVALVTMVPGAVLVMSTSDCVTVSIVVGRCIRRACRSVDCRF